MIFRKLIIAFRTKIDEKRPLTTLLQHCNDSQIEEMAVTQKKLSPRMAVGFNDSDVTARALFWDSASLDLRTQHFLNDSVLLLHQDSNLPRELLFSLFTIGRNRVFLNFIFLFKIIFNILINWYSKIFLNYYCNSLWRRESHGSNQFTLNSSDVLTSKKAKSHPSLTFNSQCIVLAWFGGFFWFYNPSREKLNLRNSE